MIEIFTDGSALGNPGPGGYAVIMKYKNKVKEISGGFRRTTNNRMELLSVIVALESINTTGIPISIYSDSKYVVNPIEKKWLWGWKKKGYAKIANPDLWKRYFVLHKKYKPTFSWIKGHAGHPENERCDRLANEAATLSNLPADMGYENPEKSNGLTGLFD